LLATCIVQACYKLYTIGEVVLDVMCCTFGIFIMYLIRGKS